MKKFILLSVLLAVNGTLLANNWEGTVNHFWGTAANWSDGTVPTAGDQAYIPPGTPNDCWVSWQDQECNILTIASGASLRIYDQVLTINSYIVTQGHLVMDHNAGELRVAGSFYWYSGSSAAITAGSSEIYVGGDWYFNSGCTAQLANGYVEFNGTGSSSIYSRSPDAGFHHLRCNKQGGTLVVNPTSTADLQVGGNLYYYTGSTFSYNSNYALIMGGSLNNQGGDAYLIAGELVYNGGSHTLQLDGDNYLYHLRLDATGTTQLQSPLDIRGNLNIDNGLLMAAGYDIEIAGNWNDNVGNGFVAGGNQVTFSGNVNNHLSSEEFHDLLVDKSGGTLTIDIGATLDVTGVVTLDQGTVHLSNSCQLQSAGQLSIAAGATLDAAGSWGVALAVGGNWLDENTLAPGFTAGTSTVTFFGSDQWQYISSPDLSSYTFHNLIIDKDFGCVINSSDDFLFTGDFEVITGCWSSPYYTAGVEHTFRGDLSIAADGGFIDENLLRFDTSSDQQLLKEAGASCTIGTIQVDKPTGTLQLAAEILNIWRLEVDQGSCNLNGARLWVDYHVIVNSGGILQLDAGAQLMLDQFSDLTVNSGGLLELVGTAAEHAVVSGTGPTQNYGGVDILSGGTLVARYTDFQRLDLEGLHIHAGAWVDPVDPFRECGFEMSEGGATLLTIDNDQVLVVEGAGFIDSYYDSAFNVHKTNDQGRVTFNNFFGDLAGQLSENDPYERVDWFGPLIPVWNFTILYDEVSHEVLLEWDYQSNVDQFNIYRSSIPNFQPSPAILYDTTGDRSYSDYIAGEQYYFYRVTAERAE